MSSAIFHISLLKFLGELLSSWMKCYFTFFVGHNKSNPAIFRILRSIHKFLVRTERLMKRYWKGFAMTWRIWLWLERFLSERQRFAAIYNDFEFRLLIGLWKSITWKRQCSCIYCQYVTLYTKFLTDLFGYLEEFGYSLSECSTIYNDLQIL